MGRSKKYSELSINAERKQGTPINGRLSSRSRGRSRRIQLSQMPCKDHFSLVEPQINAEGIHTWIFDDSCPVDVQFMTEDGRHNVTDEPARIFRGSLLVFGLGCLPDPGQGFTVQ